ncbi:MAG: [Fe-Fe] hydrogenase large subunit C-terminal domain-containing protein [Armatimonadota bacterium]
MAETVKKETAVETGQSSIQSGGSASPGVVTTIGERCKRCYTCVRNCPAKAIMVQDGRAKVLAERCVACGNCIRVCSQNAKRIISDDLAETKRMIEAGQQVVACLAPSFPASFPGARPLQVVEAVRRLGFAQVMEVAAGAELVARAYSKMVAEGNGKSHLITTPCPALVSYVEKHVPDLLPYLAPIVSPMVALGRLIKQRLNPAAKTVFIGPCLAKKVEASDPLLGDAVDAVLTFREFSDWLAEEQVELRSLPESDFDGPHPSLGRIFPVPGGLLRTSEMQADVLNNDVVVTEGVDRITELLRQIDEGNVDAKFFDLLFCEGCINGPFAGDTGNTVAAKQQVSQYTKDAIARHAEASLAQYDDLDLSREFADCRVETELPSEDQIRAVLRQTDKYEPEDELNCGACGYASCREKAIAVFNGLAESEMCLPYLIEKLQRTITELNDSRRNLLEAEAQLMQSEKLASMGQLAAGIAHEINNPLGTVLIYTHMLLKNMPVADEHREDLTMIAREAERCRNIVRGLLDFSRQSKLRDQLSDVNDVVRETLEPLTRLESFSRIDLTTDLCEGLPKTLLDPEQMRQAFINILENAMEAMPEGGRIEVRTSLAQDGKSIAVRFADTGAGIREENLERIFDPFFTTKQIGKGTGLGLAIVYGIVKMHRGAISVDSKVGVGSTFTITLPVIASREGLPPV